MRYAEFIHDRGRGPEIQGSRITVYDVLDFMIAGWHCERIADFFELHPQEVQAAMDYVRDNRLEVLREYVKILERSERGNPPELQAKLDANHQRFLEMVRQVNEAKARGDTNIRELIRKHREALQAGKVTNAGDHGGQRHSGPVQDPAPPNAVADLG